MKVFHGSYLIVYIPGKKSKVKRIISLYIRIWITAVFNFSFFVAVKIAVSIELSRDFGYLLSFSISVNVSFNDVLSDIDL